MLASNRQKNNLDAAPLVTEFQKVIADFKKTELCHQIKTMARKLFQSRQVNKLVAYGLGDGLWGFSNPAGPGNSLGIGIQVQKRHAALLAIRDTWKEEHKGAGGSFDIYLSDPSYWDIDEVVAAKFGMTVVNGDIGHQMGYLLIDECTLVVDLESPSIVPLVFEITRPAGLLTAYSLHGVDFGYHNNAEAIFSYTLTVHNRERGHEEEIIFPGIGM
jgi:hypothetical protein